MRTWLTIWQAGLWSPRRRGGDQATPGCRRVAAPRSPGYLFGPPSPNTARTVSSALPFALAGLLVGTSGCGLNSGRSEKLRYAVEDHSRAIRWGNINGAARYLPQAAAAQVAAQKSDDLRVTDVEIRRVHMQGDDDAQIVLAVDWYHASQLRVKQTLVHQHWHFTNGQWRIKHVRWLKGPPFPLLPTTGADPKAAVPTK